MTENSSQQAVADPRIEAAARAQYEADSGSLWEHLPAGPVRSALLERAANTLAQVDAADDRVRLTLDEFNAIRADALSDLGRDMRDHFGGEQYRTIDCAGVFDFIDQRSAALSDRFIEPPNLHGAMGSLIRERTAAELENVAEHLDAASLADVAPDTEPSPQEKTARLRRRVVNGCADWLRRRADQLRTGETRLYARVDRRLAVDEDQLTALRSAVAEQIERAEELTALRSAVAEQIERAEELAAQDPGSLLGAVILADELREAVAAVTPGPGE